MPCDIPIGYNNLWYKTKSFGFIKSILENNTIYEIPSRMAMILKDFSILLKFELQN